MEHKTVRANLALALSAADKIRDLNSDALIEQMLEKLEYHCEDHKMYSLMYFFLNCSLLQGQPNHSFGYQNEYLSI